MNKHEICVHIKDKEMLQKAKELLEKHEEEVDEEVFYLGGEFENFLQYHYFSRDWYLAHKRLTQTEITIEILDDILATKWRP